MAEKWTNTSASPLPRSMKPYPFSFENHLTVPSATASYSLLDDYKSADRRSARNTSSSAGICKLAAPVARAPHRVLEQAGDRHRPHAAGHGRQIAGDLDGTRVDVTDD